MRLVAVLLEQVTNIKVNNFIFHGCSQRTCTADCSVDYEPKQSHKINDSIPVVITNRITMP